MVTATNQCSKCGHEMILDRVEITMSGDTEIRKHYYACVNHRCSEFGKAFAVDGTQTEATVKRQD